MIVVLGAAIFGFVIGLYVGVLSTKQPSSR